MNNKKLLDHHTISNSMGGGQKNLENHMPALEKGSQPFKDVKPKQESARPFKFPLPRPIFTWEKK